MALLQPRCRQGLEKAGPKAPPSQQCHQGVQICVRSVGADINAESDAEIFVRSVSPAGAPRRRSLATLHKEVSRTGTEMAEISASAHYQLNTWSSSSSFIMKVRLCGAIGSL